MKRKDQTFHFKKSLQVIENLGKSHIGIFHKKGYGLDMVEAKMEISKEHFRFSFDGQFLSKNSKRTLVGTSYKNTGFKFGETSIILKDLYINEFSPPSAKGRGSFFHSNPFSAKKLYYYRLIIPLEKEIKFYYRLETIPFESDLGWFNLQATSATIENNDFKILNFKSGIKRYLSIESESLMDYEIFIKRAYVLQIALGYITSAFPGGRGYFFAYSTRKMDVPVQYYCHAFRKTMRNMYGPIYANPAGYISNEKLINKYFKDKALRALSVKEFSCLCNKILTHPPFASVLLLIMESTVGSILLMPGSFSIALETLASLITSIKDDNPNLKPITSSVVWKSVRNNCIVVIKRPEYNLTPDAIKTLIERVNYLNQIANPSRLQAPFELLGIDLSSEDLRILKTRNIFLHGSVPDLTSRGTDRPIEIIDKDAYYASMRLYTLLSILILRWIGYDNMVVNYPKVNEQSTHIRVQEGFYRQV